MARVPDAELARLKAEVSVQRLLEGVGVELRRQGKDLIGRCPLNYNATSRLVVVQSPKGAFVTGWRMSDAQLHYVTTQEASAVADPWWSSWVAAVAPYAVLLRLLVDDRVTGEEFEVVFLSLYKKDPTPWPPEIFDVLDGFFADVDDFCTDPALRAEVGGIDEAEFRRRAAVTYQRLMDAVLGHVQDSVVCDTHSAWNSPWR